MTLQIIKVSMPSDLKGQSNGKLDSALLMPVQSGQLHHLAARAFGALWVHCLHFTGAQLTATYGGWYRDYRNQEALFRRRYAIGGTGGGCKTWNGEKWCKKDSKLATAATPGTSNHGWGLAIDLAYDSDLSDGVGSDDAAYIKGHAEAWQFLLDNAEDFGFSWELQSEPWHIRYVAGDQLPTKVLEWEAFAASLVEPADPTPPPPPPPPPPVEDKYGSWPTNPNKPKLANVPARSGQDQDAVRYLQLVLRDECNQTVTVDGWFGSQTEFAVRQVQKFFGLTVDGWVGPQTWDVIDYVATH